MAARGKSLTVDDVQALARAGAVAPDPAYHAFEKGFRFDRLVNLLGFCVRVEKDKRPDHPLGYVAWAQNWAAERFRIDFNLHEGEQGDRMLLVVTAMELEDTA